MSQVANVFNFDGCAVRAVLHDNDAWFVAADVAAALGYTNTQDAIINHCKHATII